MRVGQLRFFTALHNLWMTVKETQGLIWGLEINLSSRWANTEHAKMNVHFLEEIISNWDINYKNKSSTGIFMNTIPKFTCCQHFTPFALSFVSILPLPCTNTQTHIGFFSEPFLIWNMSTAYLCVLWYWCFITNALKKNRMFLILSLSDASSLLNSGCAFSLRMLHR